MHSPVLQPSRLAAESAEVGDAVTSYHTMCHRQQGAGSLDFFSFGDRATTPKTCCFICLLHERNTVWM